MKKYFVGGIVLILLISIGLYINVQGKRTTFGVLFKEGLGEKEITQVIIEDRQNAKKVEPLIIEDQVGFKELMNMSSEMKIKETGVPPMTTYEVTIKYIEGDDEKVTAIVVGYNNTLQMPNGKFYKIEGRNDLYESIRRELDLR